MTARHAASAPTTLTERQREVLALVAAGKTNFEIAQELGITLEGAKYHVREVMGKLNVESREEAAAWYRHQRRPTTRFATFVRGLIPAAGIWKAAAGVTAGVAVAGIGALAVYAFTQSGSDDPPPAVAEPTIPGEPPLCGPDDAIFDIFEADPMDDITLLVVTGRAAGPCTLRGTIELTLTEGDPTASPPAIATSTTEVDLVLDTVRTNIVHANWTGYCGNGLIHATGSAFQSDGTLVRAAAGTDLVNAPGCNQPAGLAAVFAPPLSFRPDLGPVEEIVCPVTPGWEKQCEVVDELFAAVMAGDAEQLLRRAASSVFVCGGPQNPIWGPLCGDAPAGSPAVGIAFQHPDGSLGAVTLLDIVQMLPVGRPSGGWTIACSNDDCDKFVVGIGFRDGVTAMAFAFDSSTEGIPSLKAVTVATTGTKPLAIRRGGTTEVAVPVLAPDPRGGLAATFELHELTFTRVIPSY